MSCDKALVAGHGVLNAVRSLEFAVGNYRGANVLVHRLYGRIQVAFDMAQVNGRGDHGFSRR